MDFWLTQWIAAHRQIDALDRKHENVQLIPYQALITPIFFMFAKLKLTNTLVGLAIVHTAIHIPFSLYIMRNSFDAVPRELEEAAVIDGCNSWQALLKIYLPAIRPAIGWLKA